MASRPKGREHPNIGLQLHYPVNFSFIRRGRMEERKVNPAKGRPDNVLEVVIPVHPDAISFWHQDPGTGITSARAQLLKPM